jgi:hypothetical protein
MGVELTLVAPEEAPRGVTALLDPADRRGEVANA